MASNSVALSQIEEILIMEFVSHLPAGLHSAFWRLCRAFFCRELLESGFVHQFLLTLLLISGLCANEVAVRLKPGVTP